MSKLVLRMCEEHEFCQLQSVDDGPWEHTPEDQTIGDRFEAWPPTQGEVERGVSDSVLVAQFAEFADLVATMLTEHKDFAERLGDVERGRKSLASTAQVSSLSDRVETLTTRVDRLMKDTAALFESRARSEQAVTRELGESLSVRQDTSTRVDGLASKVGALENLVTEKVNRAESLMNKVEARSVQLDKVDDLFKTVKELERQLLHEREERLANTRKFMQGIQKVAELRGK